MPTYVFECKECSEQTELIQKVSDPPLAQCPSCGGQVRKVLFPVGVVFKGSGFHINDYRKPEAKSGDSGSSAESKTESKTESKEPAASKA